MTEPAFQRFVYDDSGRAVAGFKVKTGDCACRAIAIVTGKPYREVHDNLNALCALLGELVHDNRSRCRQRRMSADVGIPPPIARLYLGQLGWHWTPTNAARLHRWDLPSGRIIVSLSKHLVALIDNVVHDHGEHWRGRRAVYGYYSQNPQENICVGPSRSSSPT
jgi:hypothetical protein